MNGIEISLHTAAAPVRQTESGASPQTDRAGKEARPASSQAGRTPDGYVPDGHAPDGRTLDGRTPDGHAPDGYVPQKGESSPGIYRVEQDADGKRRIRFDAPKKEGEAESCTCNTDRVDREINRLREKQAALKQQIAQEKDAPAKQAELEKRLAQVEKELSRKDTEAYRRQHASFS